MSKEVPVQIVKNPDALLIHNCMTAMMDVSSKLALVVSCIPNLPPRVHGPLHDFIDIMHPEGVGVTMADLTARAQSLHEAISRGVDDPEWSSGTS